MHNDCIKTKKRNMFKMRYRHILLDAHKVEEGGDEEGEASKVTPTRAYSEGQALRCQSLPWSTSQGLFLARNSPIWAWRSGSSVSLEGSVTVSRVSIAFNLATTSSRPNQQRNILSG